MIRVTEEFLKRSKRKIKFSFIDLKSLESFTPNVDLSDFCD